MAVSLHTLQAIVAPFLAEKGKAYVAIGCYRVYVAAVPSVKCKRCGGCHTNYEISDISDLAAVPAVDPSEKAR